MQNKIYHVVIMLLLLPTLLSAASTAPSNLELHITAKQHAKSKLLVGVVGEWPEGMADLITTIKKDLEFTQQFVADTRTFEALGKKEEVAQLHKQGYAVAVFINYNAKDATIEWRLYDTALADMIKGKKYHQRGEVVQGWAHNIADALWQELTSYPGFFSTKIAYCKEVPGNRHRRKEN